MKELLLSAVIYSYTISLLQLRQVTILVNMCQGRLNYKLSRRITLICGNSVLQCIKGSNSVDFVKRCLQDKRNTDFVAVSTVMYSYPLSIYSFNYRLNYSRLNLQTPLTGI